MYSTTEQQLNTGTCVPVRGSTVQGREVVCLSVTADTERAMRDEVTGLAHLSTHNKQAESMQFPGKVAATLST